MREFMTRVSDYLNERRNNPDRQEDRLAVVIIGVAAVIVIVLLLLLLWGYIARGRGQKEDESILDTATYEEKAPEYMAQNEGDAALWQEYAARIDYLNGKVEELLAAMTQVEQNLDETMEQYREGDATILEEISSLHAQVNTIIYDLKESQTNLYDLTDIVQVMNEETIPMIQEQIVQIQEDLNQVYVDIANLYTRVAALEQEDVKIWESIGNVEDIIGGLSDNTLRYRYDQGTNTLYLEPYRK